MWEGLPLLSLGSFGVWECMDQNLRRPSDRSANLDDKRLCHPMGLPWAEACCTGGLHLCKYMNKKLCEYIYICKYMCIYIHIYICIYICICILADSLTWPSNMYYKHYIYIYVCTCFVCSGVAASKSSLNRFKAWFWPRILRTKQGLSIGKEPQIGVKYTMIHI